MIMKFSPELSMVPGVIGNEYATYSGNWYVDENGLKWYEVILLDKTIFVNQPPHYVR